jgi:hypothetical protein
VNTQETTLRLLEYCRKQDWAGYDPYDALNSRVFRATPFFRSKWCRIAFTQFMKRSPINFRPLLRVPMKRNPKGTALFIMALLKLRRANLFTDDATIFSLIDDLIASRSQGQQCACWGYSFDWQTRGYLVPEGSPNIICTTFAGNALLDAWETYHNDECLKQSISAAQYLKDTLCEVLPDGEVCFNYTPLSPSLIHNANLLGAAYLARIAKAANQDNLRDLALRTARYSVNRQAPDGSWTYGEAATQQWIDNFHTGYNLCALNDISRDAGVTEFDGAVRRGLQFFIEHFFDPEGAPRYYHNRTFPLDVHSAAQSIITLVSLGHLDHRAKPLASTVFRWATANLLDSSGFFYYQKHRCYSVRIPYIRWNEAWTILALSTLLGDTFP